VSPYFKRISARDHCGPNTHHVNAATLSGSEQKVPVSDLTERAWRKRLLKNYPIDIGKRENDWFSKRGNAIVRIVQCEEATSQELIFSWSVE
jgi:hypothetical protein